MAKELYVSSTPHETKVAVVEEDQLSEIYFERENEYTLAGSIYKGRVTRVLPGMQSAFVNIGLERDAFLYVSDFLLEEDEDSDAIGEAVSRSRNESPVIEVRSAEGHQRPIEAEEILPPLEGEGEDTEQGTAETASSESSAQREPEREGARKWRGRRRRGRGGRDRSADRGANDKAASEGGDREKPVEAASDEDFESKTSEATHESKTSEPEAEDHSEPRHESREERHDRRPEPRHDRHEGRHDNRRESRHDSRSEQGFEQRPEPILLPGESISKYQPNAAQSTATSPQAPVKTESAPRPKPSTEYSLDPSAFSAGSMVLPGESLAKYDKKSQPKHAAKTAEPEAAIAQPIEQPEEHGFLQDSESAGPVPHHFEQEEKTEARVEAPRVFHRREPAPVIEAEAAAEAVSIEHEEQAALDPVEPQFESKHEVRTFNSAAAPEIEEVQEEEFQQEETQEDKAEAATHLDSGLEAPAQQTWSPAATSENRGLEAHGVMEEERLKKEESDLPGFQEDADMGEFEELEEEVLGRSGEPMLPMGSELMEAVRDARVNERATGKYEAEGLEPDELEEVEDAFGEEEDLEGSEEEGADESGDGEGNDGEQHAPAAAGSRQRTDRNRPQDRRGGRRGGPPGRRMR